LEPRIEAALRDAAAWIAREIRLRMAEGRSHWFPKDF
jgi:hypothetical protein